MTVQPASGQDRFYVLAEGHNGYDVASFEDSEALGYRKRFADLFLVDSDWFWECDGELRLTLVTQQFFDLTGLQVGETLGHTLMEIGFQPETEAVARNLEAARKGHEPYRGIVWTGRAVDGRQLWFRSGALPLFDPSGGFIGYRGVGSDLTELHETRERLRASEARVRNFAASASDWFWETDADFRLISISRSFYRVSGYTPELLLGRTLAELGLVAVDRENRRRLQAAIDGQERIRDVVVHGFLPSGSRIWLRLGAEPFRDGTGEFAGYRGTAANLTALFTAKEALQHNEIRFRDLAEATSDWFWEMGPDLHFTYVSERVIEFTGQPASWYLGKRLRPSARDPDEDDHWRRHFADLEARRAFRDFRFRRTAPDGQVQWYSISGKPFSDAAGNFAGYRGAATDVSAEREVELALQRSEARTRAILDTVLDGIIVIDANGVIQSTNPAAEGLFGYDGVEMIGRNVKMLMPPEIAAEHDGYVGNYLRTGEARVIGIGREITAQRSDGSQFPAELAVTAFLADGRQMFAGMVRDISERKSSEARLRELATTDPLTGLANRRRLDDLALTEFSRWRRHRTPLSLAMLDIDHFKAVNDTHGHAAGDRVLVALAETCRNAVRDIDTVARFGGEEFIILLPSARLNEAVQVAERIRKAVAAMPVDIVGGGVDVRVSLGVATANDGNSNLKALIEAADAALYEAKRSGRNRVCRA